MEAKTVSTLIEEYVGRLLRFQAEARAAGQEDKIREILESFDDSLESYLECFEDDPTTAPGPLPVYVVRSAATLAPIGAFLDLAAARAAAKESPSGLVDRMYVGRTRVDGEADYV